MKLFSWFRAKAPAAPGPLLDAPDGFQVGVEAFCWRVLQNAHLRVIARHQGRDPLTFGEGERLAVLEPYRADMERDARSLAVAIAEARAQGIAGVQSALHRAPGLDHEMVDQAIVFAYEQAKGGRHR